MTIDYDTWKMSGSEEPTEIYCNICNEYECGKHTEEEIQIYLDELKAERDYDKYIDKHLKFCV